MSSVENEFKTCFRLARAVAGFVSDVSNVSNVSSVSSVSKCLILYYG
jgi:hypothetical protein